MASSLLVVDVVFFFFLIKRYQTAAHLIRCCLLCQRHTRYFIFLHPHFYVSRKSLPYCPLDEINYYDIHGNSDSTRYCLWTDSRDAEKIISIFLLLSLWKPWFVQLTSINISFHLIRHDILSHHKFMLCEKFCQFYCAVAKVYSKILSFQGLNVINIKSTLVLCHRMVP